MTEVKERPHTDIAKGIFSPSALAAYQKCPMNFYYEYVMGIVPKEKKIELSFGSIFHKALAGIYKGGTEKDSRTMLDEIPSVLDGAEKRSREKAHQIFGAYLEKWREKDKKWKILAVEEEAYVELPDGTIILTILDLLIEEELGKFVVDHKTTAAFGATRTGSFRPSLQMGSYLYAARALFGDDVRDARINDIFIGKEPKFQRFDVNLTVREMERFPRNVALTVEDIKRDVMRKEFAQYENSCHAFYHTACSFVPVCLHGEELIELRYRKKEENGDS